MQSIIGHKIFYCIIGEQFFKFIVQLCYQCFIVYNNKCRFLQFFNDIRHSKCFSRACYPQQCLILQAFLKSFCYFLYSLRLVACWFIFRLYFKPLYTTHPIIFFCLFNINLFYYIPYSYFTNSHFNIIQSKSINYKTNILL